MKFFSDQYTRRKFIERAGIIGLIGMTILTITPLFFIVGGSSSSKDFRQSPGNSSPASPAME